MNTVCLIISRLINQMMECKDNSKFCLFLIKCGILITVLFMRLNEIGLGLQAALDMQKEITAKRGEVDSLQSRIQHLEEQVEKLQQVKAPLHWKPPPFPVRPGIRY